MFCWVCSISGALGWAATLDILLLFYPVPRSIFLHWLMGTNFPTIIKYHRCASLGGVRPWALCSLGGRTGMEVFCTHLLQGFCDKPSLPHLRAALWSHHPPDSLLQHQLACYHCPLLLVRRTSAFLHQARAGQQGCKQKSG